MRRRTILGAITALTLAFPAFAGEQTGTEMLFDTDALEGLTAGATLHYIHERDAVSQIPTRPILDGKIVVTLDGEEDALRSNVELFNAGKSRKLHDFSASQGNPIFITFLESSISAVTFATKGSPFYIRNRFKGAFATGGTLSETTVDVDGETVTATEITYQPFKGDRNAERMGRAFEELSVTFVLSDAVPGEFVSMKTESFIGEKQYFIESVRFIDAKS